MSRLEHVVVGFLEGGCIPKKKDTLKMAFLAGLGDFGKPQQ